MSAGSVRSKHCRSHTDGCNEETGDDKGKHPLAGDDIVEDPLAGDSMPGDGHTKDAFWYVHW